MRSVNYLDYGVIALYLVMLVAVGLYFRKKVHSASEYFAGGNLLPWWAGGISLYMSTFTAWTFSGAAGFAYHNGFWGILYFASWSVGYFTLYRLTATRWRRARVLSPIEYAATRYNVPTQQFVGWVTLLSRVLSAGLTLTAVSKIVGSTLGFPVESVAVVAGAVILIYTYFGGLWAVAVTDVVQFIILIAITVIIMPLSLQAVGGLTSVVSQTPAMPWSFEYRGLIYNIHWLVGVVLLQGTGAMSIHSAQRYYSVQDERAARRVGLTASLLFLTVPVLFGLPPLAGKILWPDLSAVGVFQGVHHPSDVIYVGLCLATLPNGLIGLFLAAMFAATMSSLDTNYNVASAIVSRDIYKGVFRKSAGDQEMLFVGKITTLVIGLGVTGLGVWYARSTLGIFNVMMLISSIFNLPIGIPMAVGLISRRIARWSLAGAMAWGLGIGLLSRFVLHLPIGYMTYASALFTCGILFGSIWLGEWYRTRRWLVGAAAVLCTTVLWVALPQLVYGEGSEAQLWILRISSAGYGLSVWLFACLFASETDDEREMVAGLFRRLATPVDVVREIFARGIHETSSFGLVGTLSVLIGVLVWVLALFPQGRDVWWANAGLGAVLVAIGWLMASAGRRSETAYMEKMKAAGRRTRNTEGRIQDTEDRIQETE